MTHPIGMNATQERASHDELREQYATALRFWSETRAAYGANSPEVVAATVLVEELEQQLKAYPAVRAALELPRN